MLISLVTNGELQRNDAPDVVVPWWSFTKTVLAAAALSLVRDGRVGLDDRAPQGPFTLRQLLRHEAGLADYGELPDYHAAVAAGEAPWRVDEMLGRLEATRLRYAPGSGWGYSNVGYLYVGQWLEQVANAPLTDVLQQLIFAPLGVEASLSRPATQGLPEGYDRGWVYHGLLTGSLGHAALLLDRLLGGTLLPTTLLSQMQDPKVLGGPIPGRPWTVPGYGLGLMIGQVQGGLTLHGHTGGGPGSTLAVYRSTDFCCAVFSADNDQGAVESAMVDQLRAGFIL